MSDVITISLNFQERKFLLYLADKAGRVIMRDSSLPKDVLDALAKLKSKECIDIEPTMIIGHKEYILTSIGTNLVTEIKKTVVEG